MTLANTSRVTGETPTAYAYRCPALQRNGAAVAAGTWRLIALKRLLFRQAPDGHETKRVSRLSDETAGTAGSQKRKRLASVRENHRARRARDQERAANRRAGERVVSLEVEVSAFLGKTFYLSREHMEASGGSTLLSRLVFRRTRDQERMATQWVTALKRCSGQQQELDVETVT